MSAWVLVVLVLLVVLAFGAVLFVKWGSVGVSGGGAEGGGGAGSGGAGPKGVSENWKLGWDASRPIVVGGRRYLVREVVFTVDYDVSGERGHLVVRKGLREGSLGGRSVYVLYAHLDVGGEEYRYTVYVDPDYLEDYTGGVLWVPSVFDMINGEGILRLEIVGPDCYYLMDEAGNIEGNTSCGTTGMSEGFQKYNTVWSFPTGFYGGIYSDVLTWVTLTESGKGYTVERGETVDLAGMKFETYDVRWSGEVQSGLAQAQGRTVVAPELPFPVEVEAVLKVSPGEEYRFHVRLTDLKLRQAG